MINVRLTGILYEENFVPTAREDWAGRLSGGLAAVIFSAAAVQQREVKDREAEQVLVRGGSAVSHNGGEVMAIWKPTLAAVVAVALLGCVDPSMLKEKEKVESAEATAPAPVEPAGRAAQPAGGGLVANALIAPDMDARPAGGGNAPAAENPAPAAPAAPSFPQDNTKIVDKNKILAENPGLIETENKINAADPLTAASQSYFTIGSRAQVMALKHSIDLHKAQFEKPPTFAEFETMLRQAGVALKGLYRWQVYAYDERTGEISILEDREMKKRLYEEQGLKVE